MAGQDIYKLESRAVQSLDALYSIFMRMLEECDCSSLYLVHSLADSVDYAWEIVNVGIDPEMWKYEVSLMLWHLFADGAFDTIDKALIEFFGEPVYEYLRADPENAPKILRKILTGMITLMYSKALDKIISDIASSAWNKITKHKKLEYYDGLKDLRDIIGELKDEVQNYMNGNTPYISVNVQGIKDALLRLGLPELNFIGSLSEDDADVIARIFKVTVDSAVKSNELGNKYSIEDLYKWLKELDDYLSRVVNDLSAYVEQGNGMELSNSA